MTSRYAALNRNLERLKMSVQMRKQQRSNWMQRLMRDTTSHSGNSTHGGHETGDRALDAELDLVSVDTTDAIPASVAPSCEMEQRRTSKGMPDVASNQASDNNTTRLH